MIISTTNKDKIKAGLLRNSFTTTCCMEYIMSKLYMGCLGMYGQIDSVHVEAIVPNMETDCFEKKNKNKVDKICWILRFYESY